MKKIIYFLLLLVFFAGCKKEDNNNYDNNNNNDNNNNGSGKLIISMTYKDGMSKASSNKEELRYTQFGDYITSISPSVYVMKFIEMRFQHYEKDGAMWDKSITLIHSNMPWGDEARFANFSNNNTVNLSPSADEHYDTREDAIYNIFVFCPMFIYQEFELPVQYENITVLENLLYENGNSGIDLNTNTGIGGTRNELSVKGNEKPFIKDKLFENVPHSYVFGSTDSTYVWLNPTQGENGQSINDPLGQGGYIIRSDRYENIVVPAVSDNDTLIIHATMTFDTNNLIQIYAGADNIPYTADDIFVYAPKYWERLIVSLATH